jgi:hypothetical protein
LSAVVVLAVVSCGTQQGVVDHLGDVLVGDRAALDEQRFSLVDL